MKKASIKLRQDISTILIVIVIVIVNLGPISTTRQPDTSMPKGKGEGARKTTFYRCLQWRSAGNATPVATTSCAVNFKGEKAIYSFR
jgi:hypothetical protein